MTSKYKYNHTVHDKKDERDHMFTALDFQVTLPPSTDLRTKPYFPPVLDQGQIGSCTCNATASSVYFCLGKENIEQWFPSRLFLYYNTRVLIEHTEQPFAMWQNLYHDIICVAKNGGRMIFQNLPIHPMRSRTKRRPSTNNSNISE